MKKIYCDQCETDLTLTSNSINWRIVVSSELIQIDERLPVSDMHIYPQIQGMLHFCSMLCLKKWINGEKDD